MNQLALDFESWASSEEILSHLLSSVGRALSNVASVHDALLANPLEYFTVQVLFSDKYFKIFTLVPKNLIFS